MKVLKRVLLLAVPLLLACEKEVTNIRFPGEGSQLVVNSFISPQDTLLRVYVYESQPVVGSQQGSTSDVVKDATVTLSDGQQTIRLSLASIFTNSPGDVYQVRADEFPIRAGNTYYLEVRTPDGRRANAQCTVPVAGTAPELLLDSADLFENGSNYKQYTGALRWQDPAGVSNYYRVAGEVRVLVNSRQNDVYEDRQRLDWDLTRSDFYSDSRLDGTVFISSKATFTFIESVRSVTLYAYLMITDRSYFEYHRTLRLSDVDNPFAEPVLIYTNIEGGLGVFAAYTKETVAVKIK